MMKVCIGKRIVKDNKFRYKYLNYKKPLEMSGFILYRIIFYAENSAKKFHNVSG